MRVPTSPCRTLELRPERAGATPETWMLTALRHSESTPGAKFPRPRCIGESCRGTRCQESGAAPPDECRAHDSAEEPVASVQQPPSGNPASFGCRRVNAGDDGSQHSAETTLVRTGDSAASLRASRMVGDAAHEQGRSGHSKDTHSEHGTLRLGKGADAEPVPLRRAGAPRSTAVGRCRWQSGEPLGRSCPHPAGWSLSHCPQVLRSSP